MDVLEHVREINTDDTPVEEKKINGARQALLRQIAREERVPSQRGRRWAGASLIVGGIAATVVAVSVLTPARVDPAAAAVLEEAAEVTIQAADAQLAPGQYLRIQTDASTLWMWDLDMGDADMRFNNGNRADAEAGLVISDTRVLYVPADRSDDWIWDTREHARVVDTFGAPSDEAIADWTAMNNRNGYWQKLQRLPGGEIPAGEGDNHEYLLDSYRRSYSEMPRQPRQLLDWLRSRSGDPNVADQWVLDAMTDVLAANLMPADLRAATLRAMALLPGIQLTSTAGTNATLEYRSGVGSSSRTTTIVVDTAEGLISSVTEQFRGHNGGPIPEAVPNSSTTVTTTVVDSPPQP